MPAASSPVLRAAAASMASKATKAAAIGAVRKRPRLAPRSHRPAHMPTSTTSQAPTKACQPCVNQSSESVSRSTLPSRFGVVLVGQGKADAGAGFKSNLWGVRPEMRSCTKARADASLDGPRRRPSSERVCQVDARAALHPGSAGAHSTVRCMLLLGSVRHGHLTAATTALKAIYTTCAPMSPPTHRHT